MTRALLVFLPLAVLFGCNNGRDSSESQLNAAGSSQGPLVTLAEVQDAVTKIVKQNPNEVALHRPLFIYR
ncbi:MAG: hypothetical protein RL189_1376 [Pseudomonadota bacterium]|jgi:hypothetical protein